MPKVYNKHHGNVPVGAVYVGRPSKWGNPFAMGENMPREKAIEYYRLHVAKKHAEIKHELAGRDLVCFCAPKPCHADILLEIANDLSDRQSAEPGDTEDSDETPGNRT